jgi:multicomponent K+:H+ antiporter subunit D
LNHLPIVPVLLPLIAGSVLLLSTRWPVTARHSFGLASVVAQLAVAVALFVMVADGSVRVYALGGWAPPFGIVLVVDRLAAALLVLTGIVACASLLYAVARERESSGPRFHALFQFQLLGIQGAFLTGDLFNLFVFFEVLLIASYALLLHGLTADRVKAAVHVVVLNLVGSGLFLLGVALIYGVTGTLNFADLARVIPSLTSADAPLVRTGALLLLIVFALKSALLPLGFWLPRAYGAAAAAVAALFAVLTKVGVYAMLRLYPLAFGPPAGELANVVEAWILPLALATLVFGALGVLAARTLRIAAGWVVVYSVGSLLVAVALFSESGYAAAVYYTMHSTLASAALFLVVDLVAGARASAGDRLDTADAMPHGALLGSFFFITAVAVAGLPPLSGFVGKVLILDASGGHPAAALIWSSLLGAALVVIVALSRAGSAVFWRILPGTDRAQAPRPSLAALAAPAVILGCVAALVAWGGSATAFARAVGRDLANPAVYVDAVLGGDPAQPDDRRRLR